MQLIAHSDRVFSIPCFLSRVECAELIGLAEASGFESASVRTVERQVAMPKIRNNERAMFEHRCWVDALWQRIAITRLPKVDGEVAVGLPKDIRFYKYSSGQRFKMHKDGPWKERGLASKLTFLVYLNDGFIGGETDFREFKVVPSTGAALLFVHDTWHEGASVKEGTKYVLRSDVLYAVDAGTLDA
ncbi:prolyl hydroxylase family protein [Roseateles sp. DC23W]|uniref:Prolyl hydroxylase family protein n=1 Tax=Pelomonas dachongensis TaxID=3299029 RepID=A0ABW7ENV6_9BURK